MVGKLVLSWLAHALLDRESFSYGKLEIPSELPTFVSSLFCYVLENERNSNSSCHGLINTIGQLWRTSPLVSSSSGTTDFFFTRLFFARAVVVVAISVRFNLVNVRIS